MEAGGRLLSGIADNDLWLSVTTDDRKSMNCPGEIFECRNFRPLKEFHNRMNKRLIQILTIISSCHIFFQFECDLE